ncbi:peptidase S8/S53 domain-containing protein [Stachybotrys elegans]|uniref:Peptidase S8/S53 domain-containing protein n=1 Tax=Stachybotrys elegans TaxID=80388 RepID=A0A8K0WQ28_9HYPO|nr:peptidase S8/S53 domain-containing protein [Stachybotrys elegans]
MHKSFSGTPKQISRGGQESDDSGIIAPKTIPKAYIVELEKGTSLEGRSEDGHARFRKRAEEANVEYQVRHEFRDSSLFYGLSIDVTEETSRETLEALPEVRKIWPVVEYSHPTPVGFENLDIGGPVAGQYGYNTSVIRGENYQMDFNLKMAGVHHLHSHGFKGQGVKVAIIDSGVDYRHPALGGGFGPGKKVAFGRNYIDDGQGGPEDPIATCSSGGHGTHVAGIVGGEDPKDIGFGLIGVAPEATLGMYRVFSCGGSASSDVIFQAIIDAYYDGADIISMSLGADSGWERADPFGELITAVKQLGVAVIIAAGNRGRQGPMLTGSPGIAADAVAVASVDGARYPTTYKVKSNRGGEEWRYSSVWPMEGEFYVYAPPNEEDSYVCTRQAMDDGVAFVRDNGWNISETFFMVRQSNRCGLDFSLINGQYLGFKAVIVWRDQEFQNPYDNNYQSSAPPLWTLSLDHVDGPKLYKAVTSDMADFRLQFSDRRFLSVDSPSAGFTSNYSSMGNSWEFNVFKPLLAAPGHLILSTWPLEGGGYSIISGTSMATPFVSGCYAVLKSAFPNLTPDELTNLFVTTAKPAKYWGDSDVLHTVAHQGAGTINVWDAYNSGTKFDSSVINAGQSAEPVSRNITFTNTLGRSKTFAISHSAAGLMQRTPYGELDPIGWYVFGLPSKPIYAEVEFETPTTVTLGPGESTVVSFTITPPAGVDPDTIPIYSGFINFVSGRDAYNVPYMGMPYVINEAPVLERDPILADGVVLPKMISHLNIDGYAVLTDDDLVYYNYTDGWFPNDVFPGMAYFARQPTDAYRLDLVAANTTYEPTYWGFNRSNVFETYTPDLTIVDTFGGVDSMSVVFQDFFLPPVYHMLGWYGSLNDADGWDIGFVPTGDYRWLLRVLPIEKPYNDPESWESWLGPVMRITDLSA